MFVILNELRTIIELVQQYEHLTLTSILTTMAVAVSCGLLIYLVYRFFYRGVLYSENFAVLIVLVTGSTAFIITTIGANLILSLGMVGALSIVRFRSAVKEPLDIGFLFLGISAGLTAGARLYLVAFVGTICLCAVFIVMSYMRKEKRKFLLILRFQKNHKDNVLRLLQNIKYSLKNESFSDGITEMTVEVNVKKNNSLFMENFTSAKNIQSAVLLEYNGDYT